MKSGEKYALGGSAFRIGRDPDCALRVNDPHASRLHAEIRPEGDVYLLYDLSTNGTWVNAERVEKSRALSHGDMVRVASESFVFMVGPESGEEEARAARAATSPTLEAAGEPKPREPTGRTDPGEQTAFLKRPVRRPISIWVYVGAAFVVAAALFALLALLLTS